MKTEWKKGLDTEGKKEVELSFNGSGVLRKRLESLLSLKINASDKKSFNAEGYDCPNWAYRQADIAGYKRAMNEIISLIS